MWQLQQLRAQFPADLRQAAIWLPWMAVPRAGGRTGKCPALPVEGRLRPVDWRRGGLELESALDLAEEFGAPGIGLVLRPAQPWTCLDFDGDVPPWALTLRTLLGDAGYAERSPGGTGVHLWLPIGGVGNRRLPGIDVIGWGFVTCTGVTWPAPSNPVVLPALPAGLSPGLTSGAVMDAVRSPPLTDEAVLRRLRRARNGRRAQALLAGDWAGYPTRSEADLALIRMLRWWTQDRAQILRLLRASGLRRDKWDNAGYLERTLNRALALGGPVWSGGRRG